jgi:Fic family protein
MRLDALCAFANATADEKAPFIHPVVRAILLHFMLAYDHPFTDGNGRTARALFSWHMRTHGYWLVEYLSISRILREAPAQYARAFLYTETDAGDTTYFLLHQLQTIRRAVEELHRYLERKVREVRHVERLLDGAADFNHRQITLLGNALRDGSRTHTFTEHATSHRVTHETARADLSDLAERGLLERTKVGRQHVFHAPADLVERLRRLGEAA